MSDAKNQMEFAIECTSKALEAAQGAVRVALAKLPPNGERDRGPAWGAFQKAKGLAEALTAALAEAR